VHELAHLVQLPKRRKRRQEGTAAKHELFVQRPARIVQPIAGILQLHAHRSIRRPRIAARSTIFAALRSRTSRAPPFLAASWTGTSSRHAFRLFRSAGIAAEDDNFAAFRIGGAVRNVGGSILRPDLRTAGAGRRKRRELFLHEAGGMAARRAFLAAKRALGGVGSAAGRSGVAAAGGKIGASLQCSPIRRFSSSFQGETMKKLLQNFNMWPGIPTGADKAWVANYPYVINVDTPSLYLYPEQKQEVVVKLDVRGQGVMTSSIPPYNDGWHTLVDPAQPYSRITLKYAPPFDNVPVGFLDYHAIREGDWQEEEGWAVARRDVRTLLSDVLDQIGCNAIEREDYLHIVPRVIEEKYPNEATRLLALPQVGRIVDDSVGLDVQPKPDSVYRLWIYFKELGAKEKAEVRAPKLPKIRRTGFHVVELGIVEEHTHG
jgi:hypothetical protein